MIGRSADFAQIMGGSDELTQLLGQYQAAGLEYLICDFMVDGVDDMVWQLEIMAQQIMPQLSGE